MGQRKIGKSSLALGVVYFPVDNNTNRREDATQLRDELLTNIAELQNRFDHILLVGDFNGKLSMYKNPTTNSFNGELMDTFLEATDLCLLNNSDKCTGQVTWSRGQLQSTIDYAFCSPTMFKMVESLIIDEDHNYSLGSDHNFFIIKLKASTAADTNTHTQIYVNGI